MAKRIGLASPYQNIESPRQPFLDRVWQFDADTHFTIVSGIIADLRQTTELSTGVLNSLELCLNEVSDNVLVHSGDGNDQPVGFMMASVDKSESTVAIAIYDNGIGIPNSLARANIPFTDKRHAITLALQRGVTDGHGAGNGLWMLDNIVRQNRGSLEIVSDGARYALWHPDPDLDVRPRSSFSKALTLPSGTTLVDFQLYAERPVNLAQAMQTRGFIDLWAESHEDDTNEKDIRLNVAREAPGLGSRIDAAAFRTLALNALANAKGLVILDFCDAEIISMSFADEVVRKLIDRYGHKGFAQRFRIEHLNSACAQVIETVMETQALKTNGKM